MLRCLTDVRTMVSPLERVKSIFLAKWFVHGMVTGLISKPADAGQTHLIWKLFPSERVRREYLSGSKPEPSIIEMQSVLYLSVE